MKTKFKIQGVYNLPQKNFKVKSKKILNIKIKE